MTQGRVSIPVFFFLSVPHVVCMMMLCSPCLVSICAHTCLAENCTGTPTTLIDQETPGETIKISGHRCVVFVTGQNTLFVKTPMTMTRTLKEVRPTVVRGVALQA